jgi:hypothetical protein
LAYTTVGPFEQEGLVSRSSDRINRLPWTTTKPTLSPGRDRDDKYRNARAFLDQVRRCQVVQGPVAKSESSCRAYAHLDLSIRTRRRGKLRSSTGRKYWSKSGFPRASEVTAYYCTPQHTPLFDVTRSSAFTLPSPPVPARAVTLYTLGLLLCHQNKMLMMSCHIILRPSHRKLY